jgi:hypothetical protein
MEAVMASLNPSWFSWLCFWEAKPKAPTKPSKRAYDFAEKVHRETGGPTPELMLLQRAFIENERKLRQLRGGKDSSRTAA